MSPQAAVQPAKVPVSVKQSTPSDLFDRIQRTHDSISRRAFEIFDNNGRWFGRDWEDWFRAESELLHPVHLEMTESDGNLTVRAEVPGFSANELVINVDPNKLTIVGKHEAQEERKKAKTIYSERCAKEILRVVYLPADVDSSKASATLRDGILNIELPKAVRAKTVRIEPKAV
jgi:HSP20 family protein